MRIEELSPEKSYPPKPCPFCGSTEIDIKDYSIGNDSRVFSIECKNCWTTHRRMEPTPDEAIKRWNTRVLYVVDGPTGPTQRWWGIYDTKRKLWSRKADGEIFHYPVPGLAQAHLDNVITDMGHQVDGRGHSLTEQLVIKEMIAANNDGLQDVV